jgi:ribosomal protein S18 acetylase RimI-like enzyme
MTQIIIATTEHAALIADISRETFYESFEAQNTKTDMDKFMNEQFTKEKLMAEVGMEENHFLLAYHNSLLAGYVKLKNGPDPALNSVNAIEISRIYARKTFIGKGIGKALMQASLAQAETMQKEWIWLGVWEQNQRAIQFYTAFGFKKFSEHDFLLGDDLQRDWLMKRRLC